MKNSTKILIGVVVVVLIGAGVYFGNTKLQKGSFKSLLPPDFTISDISTKFSGSNGDKLTWIVTIKNKGTCFKDSPDVSKKVKIELYGLNAAGKMTEAKPTSSDPDDYYGYTWLDSICDWSIVSFAFDNPNPFVAVSAVIDRTNEIYESNETNNERTEKGSMGWVEK